MLTMLSPWLLLLSSFTTTLCHSSLPRVAPNPLTPAQVRVPLSAVSLDPASPLFVSQARNARYMLSLNSSRLTCLFTASANLTGTWEAPTCSPYSHPGYFGHFFGHYLNALAIYLENAGASSPMGAALSAKLEGLLDTVLAVQGAWAAAGEPGYFFPRNTNAFLQLETNTQKCDPCVPYYVYHKSLAGLSDIAARLGNARARAAAIGMGDWAVARVAKVLAGGGQAVWQNVLNTEWGGMNDCLNDLFRLTGDARYLNTASAFNHWAWTAPLVVHDDELQNFHANTHLPEILGDLNGFVLTQNATQEAIVRNFVDILLANHSWATGGSNDHEWWGPPRQMLAQLNSDTEETCTQYNVAKITSGLGTLDGDPTFFDKTEQQLWNGLLGNQNLGGQWADTDSTGFHYMLPLGGAQLRKPWGDSSDGFPCCWGTSVEQFAGRHLELPFAEAPNHGTLFVNLFMPVTLTWAAHGNLTVAQTAGFPASTTSTTRLTIGGGGAAQNFTLALRVPSWARGANTVALNGAPLPSPAPVPGTYLAVTRAWASGDVLEAYFPLALAWEPIADDSAEAAGVGAVLFGPILLAAVGARSDLAPNHDMSGGPGKWVTRVPNETALHFSFAGPFGACGSGDAALDMIPLHDVRWVLGWRWRRAGPAAPAPASPLSRQKWNL